MYDVLTHKSFFGDPGHHEGTILEEDDDIVEIGALTDEFILFETITNKPFLAVYI